MYEYLYGTLKHLDGNIAILDIGGIGYKILIPAKIHLMSIALDEKELFYIAEVIREDSHTLFGFLEKEERDLFFKLSSLSGIGPKTALGIISHFDTNTFFEAIATENSALLNKIPGIGKKTAERLILDMKDKVKKMASTMSATFNSTATDALSALVNLGHDHRRAQKAVKEALAEDSKLSASGIIKLAIRKLQNT